MSDGELTVREALWKLYEKVFPAVGYLVSSTTGLAASVAVFATWLLRRARGAGGDWSPEEDEKRVVEVWRRIREQEARLEALRSAGGGVAERVAEVEKEALDRLREEYELLQLRLASYRRVESTGDEKLKRLLRRFLSRLERGEGVANEQREILERLEELWRRRAIESSLLDRVMRGGGRG